MSGHYVFQHTLQDACFRAGGPVPNSVKFTLISWTECSRNRHATHKNDVIGSNPASVEHSVLDSRWSSLADESLAQSYLFFVNKTNRCTEIQYYWYYDSTCFGQPFCPSSGVLSLHRLWYILCSFDYRCYQKEDGTTPGSKRSSQLHKMYQRRCTAKNSWWWAESLPETCRVIMPIKLEFSASAVPSCSW